MPRCARAANRRGTLMAIQPGVHLDAEYMAIQDARLETPRVLAVVFTNGHEARFPIAALPFSTSHDAVDVRLLADGDVLDVLTTEGDFRVTADELWGILQ